MGTNYTSAKMNTTDSHSGVPRTQLQVHKVTYAPHRGYPLYIVAKRYSHPALERHASDPDALTLVVLHSTSFHKETFEPTLAHLFALAARPGGDSSQRINIREAWMIDCPNHGEAAALNEELLKAPEFHYKFSCEKYAQAVCHFLTAGPAHGAKIDFGTRRLVGIGHSLGGVSITIASASIPLSSMIVIEPMLSPAGQEHLSPLRTQLVRAAFERRDVWSTRAKALHDLQQNPAIRNWDRRVLELFVQYGLRPHPASSHPEVPYNGVTLACTREQEATMYRDVDGPTKPVKYLTEACERIPVHAIFGEVIDFVPLRVQQSIVDPTSGRRFASVTKIPGAGHLVPQEAPQKLAEALYNALQLNATLSRSRL